MRRTSCCALACRAQSLATSSVTSQAALLARVRGTTRRASANSWMASCSRVPSEVANSSRYTDSAASTQPPPTTSDLFSRHRLTTMRASCMERSTSSSMYSLGPRSTTVVARVVLQPRM